MKKETMTDPLGSKISRAVKSKDKTPEMIVHRLVHAFGFPIPAPS
jgi:hypothetical protein